MPPSTSLRQKPFFISVPPITWLVLIAALALLWRLGSGSLAAWDEAIYAQVSKEMVQGGDWLTLHWQYMPWFEKPPLLMWITALFYRLFGVSEFWARIPSALSGVALVGVTYLIGKSRDNRRVGLLSAVVLLTCYHFLSFSRFGTMEVMLTLFVYLAVYFYLRLRDGDQRWWYLVWISCALALMVKGAGGIIAPAAILLTAIADKRIESVVRSRHFWLGCLLALLIVAPWHVLMWTLYGSAFTDEYIGYHVIARSTSTLEGNPSGYFYYVGKLVDGFFPWCLLVPFAIFSAIRKKLRGEPGSWILLLLGGLVFVLYTVIPTRRPWYIVPLYPALAILIAAFVVNLYQTRPAYRRMIAITSAAFIIVGGSYSFLSVYLNQKREAPVAKLARLAQSTSVNDRDTLILFGETEHFYAQVPLFYSNHPVRQTYETAVPASQDAPRYVSYEKLADLLQDSEKQIILHRDDVQRLAPKYVIQVLAEDDSLIYARIKRKS